MRAYYINLDSADERRAALEANFRAHAPSHWDLVRVPARDIPFVQHHGWIGRLRPTEKACLLSHRHAIAASMDLDDHALIVEDDVLFGPRTFAQIDELDLLKGDAVDLIYTGALIGDQVSVLQQFLTRRRLLASGQKWIIDLQRVSFCGADAYVVHKRAKAKLLALLDSLPALDIPYDLLLRQWIHQGRLRAVLVFPFLTSLSPQADTSSNGNGHARWIASNCFRRLMALDADHYPGNIMDAMQAVDPAVYDPETDNIAQIFRVLCSRACDVPG